MASARNIFYNFFTSGKKSPTGAALDLDDMVRYILLNIILVSGASFLIVFGISMIFSGNMTRGLTDLGMAFVCILGIVIMRTKAPISVAGTFTIGSFCIVCVFLVFAADIGGFAGLWIYVIPLAAVFVLGLRLGMVLTAFLFCATVTVGLLPSLAGQRYTPVMISRLGGVYILVTIFTVMYEQIRRSRERRVAMLTSQLKAERDEVTVMKDNLGVGLFLMDRNFIIQPAYSRALEAILGTDEIQGKKFTDFLSASIKTKDLETLCDYFTMVINRSFDPKMLEEINPVSEFVYFDSISGTEKTLRSNFVSVDRGEGELFIMGNLADISAEKLLQEQLEAEESKREEEMRALFQVIQVEPGVFNDFIEDMNYEFDRINEVLKNKELSSERAIVNIYQSVHAIKSNALILGLENFSVKLHELETQIKKIQDNGEISFEDILHITVELEKIMKEKDKFRDVIEKLEAFKVGVGESRRQDRYVLIETLTKACEKAAANQGKKAKFVVDKLDGIVLEKGPRRVIKEILTQLVRNSVFHGIEAPEARRREGKQTEGLIRLSIKYNDNGIHIKLADDGKGLDFDTIRRKAESLRLFRNKEALRDKNQLLRVIFSPGFSTADETDMTAGRGIGLNLVKERIKDLNGTIKLQSEPGKGTIFNIFIPLDETTGKPA